MELGLPGLLGAGLRVCLIRRDCGPPEHRKALTAMWSLPRAALCGPRNSCSPEVTPWCSGKKPTVAMYKQGAEGCLTAAPAPAQSLRKA